MKVSDIFSMFELDNPCENGFSFNLIYYLLLEFIIYNYYFN